MIGTILLFILILSVLVFAHEFGHFFVAKKAGIKVEEFGFGLPPRIWGKKIGETVYSINALPIGGFVKLLGEDQPEKVNKKDRKRAFFSQSKKLRVAALLAGVLMNFLLAILLFSFVYSKAGIPTQTQTVHIVGVAPESPAEKAGLREGDIVLFAAGQKITSSDDFLKITNDYLGKTLTLEVAREKENLLFSLTPRQEQPEGEGPLGVVISSVEMKFYSLPKQIYLGVIYGFQEAIGWLSLIVGSLFSMFRNLLFRGTVPSDVAGPVGIFQITGEVGKTGLLPVLQFIGILSVNLAVINILPFPALDGGRLLFVIIEAITGRRVRGETERLVHTIGMAFLLFLFLIITVNDFKRLFETSGILVKLRDLIPF